MHCVFLFSVVCVSPNFLDASPDLNIRMVEYLGECDSIGPNLKDQ